MNEAFNDLLLQLITDKSMSMSPGYSGSKSNSMLRVASRVAAPTPNILSKMSGLLDRFPL